MEHVILNFNMSHKNIFLGFVTQPGLEYGLGLEAKISGLGLGLGLEGLGLGLGLGLEGPGLGLGLGLEGPGLVNITDQL